MKEESCNTCRYFFEKQKHQYPERRILGLCRRYPPKTDTDMLISERYWCGEYREKGATCKCPGVCEYKHLTNCCDKD